VPQVDEPDPHMLQVFAENRRRLLWPNPSIRSVSERRARLSLTSPAARAFRTQLTSP
jgi:hypothetical protein